MAKLKAAKLLLKAGRRLPWKKGLKIVKDKLKTGKRLKDSLKVPKGRLTIPQKVQKVPIKGSIESRPTGLRRLRPNESVPRSRREMLYRGVNRYEKPVVRVKGPDGKKIPIRNPDGKSFLMDPRVKARIRKGKKVWQTEPEQVPVRKANIGDSSPIRSKRIKEQTLPGAPKSRITPGFDEDIHHIIGLARGDPLFAKLPKYKQIALAKFLAKRGFFTGNHKQNLIALKKLRHKRQHDYENELIIEKLVSVGDAPPTVRMPYIKRFMAEQNQVNAFLKLIPQ